MRFAAAPSPYRWHARLLWALIWLVLAAVALWLWLTPPGPGWVLRLGLLLVLAGLAIWLGYRIRLGQSLHYTVDRDALRIVNSANTLVVPLPDILAIRRAGEKQAGTGRWWHWPTLWLQPEGQPIIMATLPPAACLRISTRRQGDILVSPAEGQAFMQAIRQRQDLGPARHLKPDLHIAPWRRHWLWQERGSQLAVLLPAVLWLATALFLIWQYPTLPADLAVHFDALGQPDRFAPRRTLFIVPLIMALIWLGNSVLGLLVVRRQRWAATLLWGGSLLLQGLGILVLWRLLP